MDSAKYHQILDPIPGSQSEFVTLSIPQNITCKRTFTLNKAFNHLTLVSLPTVAPGDNCGTITV